MVYRGQSGLHSSCNLGISQHRKAQQNKLGLESCVSAGAILDIMEGCGKS